jgi:hypothetical protein
MCVKVVANISEPKDFIVRTVGKWFAKRKSNLPLFFYRNTGDIPWQKVVPGRIRARANYEQIKSFM